jgi:hypothetical protein
MTDTQGPEGISVPEDETQYSITYETTVTVVPGSPLSLFHS